jgi:hypothetical protein
VLHKLQKNGGPQGPPSKRAQAILKSLQSTP